MSTNKSAAALAGAYGAVEQNKDYATQIVTQDDRPFATRRRFLIWAAMCGFVGPERVTERILAELTEVEL